VVTPWAKASVDALVIHKNSRRVMGALDLLILLESLLLSA
jgi:hypothetical protein